MNNVKYLVQPLKVNQKSGTLIAKESEEKDKVVFAINFDECYGFETREEAEIKSKELEDIGQGNVVINIEEIMKDIGKNLVEEIFVDKAKNFNSK